MLLNALVSLNVLDKRDGTFFNTPASTRFFNDEPPSRLFIRALRRNHEEFPEGLDYRPRQNIPPMRLQPSTLSTSLSIAPLPHTA